MTAPHPRRRSTTPITIICCCAVIFDGYDLSMFATVIPSLLGYEQWDLGAAQVGMIASCAFMGMLVGTLICGAATDLLGRRRMLLTSMIWFSVFMGGCALAPTPELLGLFRFIAGIGLGGLLPTALALTVEFAPRGHRNLFNALVSSGFSVGAIAASLLALLIIEPFGFRPMFAIGALPLVVLVPVAHFVLPESVDFLVAKGRLDQARDTARRYGLAEPALVARAEEPRGAARARAQAPDHRGDRLRLRHAHRAAVHPGSNRRKPRRSRRGGADPEWSWMTNRERSLRSCS